jgi:RNA polymerase sigma factor (sigma-70 family)
VDFDRVFRRYHPQLFRYLTRLTADADAAEDAAQEAFVRLAGRRIAESEVRPWLFTVGTNLVRDRARKADRHRRLEGRVPRADATRPPDVEVERREAIAGVRRALDALPERDRVMLLMREEGFRYDEIARAVGVASASVGTLLARAGRRFAEAYTDRIEPRETANEASR